jgi:hypothetical protein
MSFIAKTIKGIEDITAAEVKGKIILPQTIEYAKEVKDPRTVTMIYELLDKITFSSIEDIAKKAEPVSKKLKKTIKYDILPIREGTHAFKGVDVAKEVGRVFRDQGYTIDYKEPQQTIIIDIIDNNILFGLLLHKDLAKRQHRIRHNNKSINACIAAALIKIAEVKKTEIILDPCCKDAIIPLEAAKQGIKEISAIDPLKNNVRNAVINCKYAKTTITPQCYELTWLDTLFKKQSITHLITNLLISKHDEEPEKNIKELFHQADFAVKKSIVIITNKPEIVKATPSTFSLQKEWTVSVGEMKYVILRYIRKN